VWWLDRLAAEILAPLALWVFASSLDDFLLDASFLVLWCRSRFGRQRRTSASATETTCSSEPLIALVIPCWAEQDVIERMLEHNLSQIDYANYEVWLGVYPNDLATQAKASACRLRFPRVHYIVCPHDGPTTKADCLNWIYQGLRREEARSGRRYEIILQHDAEDLIHPRSLRLAQQYCASHEMVQLPVFPLPTPLWQLTHGTYCDFFAEAHLKDLWVRTALGGFLPSAGVGTAYRRDALEKLEAAKDGQLFDPASLTEDYTIGLELHRLACSQAIIHELARPPHAQQHVPGSDSPSLLVATRAFFPRGFRAAVRQRARWMTGIALQSWHRFGWQYRQGQAYWLWRDRKGLLNHPVSVLANLVFVYGFVCWLWSIEAGVPWTLGNEITSTPWLSRLLVLNVLLLAWRQAAQAACTGRIYGWRQALTVPLRAPWANLINCCATLQALRVYWAAHRQGQEVGWTKTQHAYPDRRQLAHAGARLGEILVARKVLNRRQVQQALGRRRLGERLGECLVRSGLLTQVTLYEALGAQHGLPLATLRSSDIDPRALRCLPEPMRKKLRLIPFRLDAPSQLWLAGPEAPAELLSKKLARFERFEARFVLITPSNYQEITAGLSRQPPSHEANGKHAANGAHEANGGYQSNGKTALARMGLAPTPPAAEEVYRAT
jgi:bacteriophage N4 adsorption protein B